VKLSHCLSEHMIADFFTKPIQGQRFYLLRDMILNINSSTVHRSVLGNRNHMDALPTKFTQKERNTACDTLHHMAQ
jgi:hypothetical protein